MNADIKEKLAATKKKKKAGSSIVAVPKKQQQAPKKKSGNKESKIQEMKEASTKYQKNFSEQDYSYFEMKNSCFDTTSVDVQEKNYYSEGKGNVIMSTQHLSDEDYSDDEEEGDEGYKPGGYHPVNIGDRFNFFRYTVVDKLGWGHFSTVWLCHDKQSRNTKNEYVAIKVQKSAAHYREAAIDEIELLNTISTNSKAKGCSANGSESNFNIVSLLDHFEHSGPNGKHVCMAFEVLGENLLSVIKRCALIVL